MKRYTIKNIKVNTKEDVEALKHFLRLVYGYNKDALYHVIKRLKVVNTVKSFLIISLGIDKRLSYRG